MVDTYRSAWCLTELRPRPGSRFRCLFGRFGIAKGAENPLSVAAQFLRVMQPSTIDRATHAPETCPALHVSAEVLDLGLADKT